MKATQGGAQKCIYGLLTNSSGPPQVINTDWSLCQLLQKVECFNSVRGSFTAALYNTAALQNY